MNVIWPAVYVIKIVNVSDVRMMIRQAWLREPEIRIRIGKIGPRVKDVTVKNRSVLKNIVNAITQD